MPPTLGRKIRLMKTLNFATARSSPRCILHYATLAAAALLIFSGMKAPAQNAAEKSSPEAHVIAERGAHHRTWQRERLVTLPDGRTVNRPTGYTELATGLHYFENGAWRETREEIVITPSGAAAMQGPHRVQFTGNLNTHGAITLTAPDGKTLRSHVLGLAYTDTTTGESISSD